MKILLAYQSGLPHRNDPYITLVPTGLCYLHACLCEAGYESQLANFSAWPTSKIKKFLQTFQPDIIGISQWTHNRHISINLAATCREALPSSYIIMGGGHATFCFEDILCHNSPVDIVVRGEAEVTILELAARLSSNHSWQDISGLAFRRNNTIIVTPPRETLDTLDNLPLPARYLDRSVGINLELQSEFIVTTRGCPSSCFFCSSPDFWGKSVRFRSPEAIVDEILYIQRKYGLIYFSIRDDTFTADRKRVLQFCSLLTKQNINILWNCQSRVTAIDEPLLIEMKRAGCECIQLGIESGSPNTLKKLGKRITPEQIIQSCSIIKEIGINLSVYLISNIPDETEDDLRQTIKLLHRIHPDDGYVSPLVYYPGTKLYKDALASGIISPNYFADSSATALYAAQALENHSIRLMKELTRSRRDDAGQFNRQKSRIGYCYTTNIIAAEWYRQKGDFEKALMELQEIITCQPGNPWGWFLLGDIYSTLGKTAHGIKCYESVLQVVPQHGPSKLHVNNKKRGHLHGPA